MLMEQAEDVQQAQETAGREEKLIASLSEAQSSLENLKRLHEASQKQLFNMQSRSEEEQVGLCLNQACSPEETFLQQLFALCLPGEGGLCLC